MEHFGGIYCEHCEHITERQTSQLQLVVFLRYIVVSKKASICAEQQSSSGVMELCNDRTNLFDVTAS